MDGKVFSLNWNSLEIKIKMESTELENCFNEYKCIDLFVKNKIMIKISSGVKCKKEKKLDFAESGLSDRNILFLF